jgi:hypothetical protein
VRSAGSVDALVRGGGGACHGSRPEPARRCNLTAGAMYWPASVTAASAITMNGPALFNSNVASAIFFTLHSLKR